MKHPQKRHFRSRAHCNPLSHNNGFQYPLCPDEMDWESYYPQLPQESCEVRYLDIGMGFGGLTIALAEHDRSKLVLGMEIRAKVCEYVRLKIEALRSENEEGKYYNASCLRTNCMRYLPNYFKRGQLEKIFICFPDPHFKAKNHRRRIVSFNLLTEYAYFLNANGNGYLYTITDVKDLHDWHVAKCDAHPSFERVPDDVAILDPCVRIMIEETEEGKKVARLGGNKYFAVYKRRLVTELPPPPLFSLFNKE